MLYDLITKLENNDASIIDTIKNASVEDVKVQTARELFLTEFEDNEEKIDQVKEIYLFIVKNMRPFLEPFTEIEEGTEQNLIDPTNIPCERVFGLYKHAEKHLLNLQFGLLAQHAVAKFNRIDFNSFDENRMQEIHADIPNIEKKIKEKEKEQEANKLEAARRNRDQVLNNLNDYYLKYYFRPKLANDDFHWHQVIFNEIEICFLNPICPTELQSVKS